MSLDSDDRRFAAANRVARIQPVSAPADDDSAFLRRLVQSERRYRNTPGADSALLGARDVIMEDFTRQIKSLEERLDDLDRRRPAPATPATRKSTGLDWLTFKAMDPIEQKAAISAASVMDILNLFMEKTEEIHRALEARLVKLEASLDLEELKEV
jgi:hypothetical protein